MKLIPTHLLLLFLGLLLSPFSEASEKPNILWLVQEDTSPWIGAYGYKANIGKTPNIDKMASNGVLFKRAYVPAPVCSSCRSAFIVGAPQFRFGAHEPSSVKRSFRPQPEPPDR